MNTKVTSLALSKRLKELGIPQESEFYYNDGELKMFSSFEYPPSGKEIHFTDGTWSNGTVYSAFLAEELGEILKKVDFDIWYSYPDWRLKLSDDIETRGRDESLINAMASMVIYLKEQNLI